MSIERGLPFQRGKTYFGGATPVVDEASSNWEGREFEVDDVVYTPGSTYGTLRSREKVTLRIVRNESGVTLQGKRLLAYAAGRQGKAVSGYVRTVAGFGHPGDEYLPSGGVVDDDLFYVVVAGPAIIKTPEADSGVDMAYDAPLVALTSAAANGTTTNLTNTAGRIFAITAADAVTGATAHSVAINHLRAMSTGTSSNTSADFLCRVKRF